MALRILMVIRPSTVDLRQSLLSFSAPWSSMIMVLFEFIEASKMAANWAYVNVTDVVFGYAGSFVKPFQCYRCLNIPWLFIEPVDLMGKNDSRTVNNNVLSWDEERAESVMGGGRQVFSAEFVAQWIEDDNGNLDWRSRAFAYEFQCPPADIQSVLQRNSDCVSARLPINAISAKLTKQELISSSKMHGFRIFRRHSVEVFKEAFAKHDCSDCTPVYTVFKLAVAKISSSEAAKSEARLRKERDEISEEARRLRVTRSGFLKRVSFPPSPLSFREMHAV
ncbi:hypothetical protein DFH06DRAFT_1137487 [Mycena polygramma]|nr:hypothetical protein DFH06DRAFT_1137487 [Mycena polygramma]